MKKPAKNLSILVFGAITVGATFWSLCNGTLYLMSINGVQQDRIDMWRPRIMFCTYWVVLSAVITITQITLKKRRRLRSEA